MVNKRDVRALLPLLWVGLVVLLWGCSPELGQLGGVAEALDGQRLSFVEIQVGQQSTTTNAQGQYLFSDLTPGNYHLSVNAKGYFPHDALLAVRPGAQRLDIILTPEPATPIEAASSATKATALLTKPAQTVPTAKRAEANLEIPDFKLPLPGGFDWLLSTEPGGGFYGGDPNTGHTGKAHFAMDIIDNNRQRGELNGFPVPILAAAAGIVVEIRNTVMCQGCQFGYGNYVKVDHGNGFTAIYAHLRYPSVTVRPGDRVRQGHVLGFMGNTGHSTGIHLHFELRYLDEGAKQATILNTVPVDGRPLSKYKVGTVSRPTYYASSQRKL